MWALSEPVIRLAFATFDPLSVLLTALSAWLAIQAGYRRRWCSYGGGCGRSTGHSERYGLLGNVIDPVIVLLHSWSGFRSSVCGWRCFTPGSRLAVAGGYLCSPDDRIRFLDGLMTTVLTGRI